MFFSKEQEKRKSSCEVHNKKESNSTSKITTHGGPHEKIKFIEIYYIISWKKHIYIQTIYISRF
jgi:hypothetical protein